MLSEGGLAWIDRMDMDVGFEDCLGAFSWRIRAPFAFGISPASGGKLISKHRRVVGIACDRFLVVSFCFLVSSAPDVARPSDLREASDRLPPSSQSSFSPLAL